MQCTPFSLVTYRYDNKVHVGLVLGQQIWEINRALEIVGRSHPFTSGKDAPVRSMLSVLNQWDGWLTCLQEVASIIVDAAEEESLVLEHVELQAPVPAPGKMMNVGLNFYDHAKEMGIEVPEDFTPSFFWKGDRNCIIGPSQNIRLSSKYVDWEAELAVVIGKPAKDVSPEEAMEYVAGFTCHNDVTDRHLMMQEDGSLNFLAGKSRDTFGPLGPALVPTDQISDIDNLPIRCLVNGNVMQSTGVDRMIWGPARCVSALSGLFTLQPGDVVALGTGSGVGWTHGMTLGPGDLPRARERMLQGGGIFLKAGDTVTVDIPDVGRLENKVEA
jgi:2-keto-4-pentenoate hydratase/2-oxohepta-3-ene-1,7-dioic acid hydratase in catechol pathway